MVKLRPLSIMKFLHLHKKQPQRSSQDDNNTSSHDHHGRHPAHDPPSNNDRKFLHHASEEAVEAWNSTHAAAHAPFPATSRLSAELVGGLPPAVLERIFSFVCPHTADETYETFERSAAEDRCSLCDLRELAHCTMVCKRWRASAVKVLYHSIRIDPVHYCEREIYLSESRKHRGRFDRNGVPEDAPKARLGLLARTLRDDRNGLGRHVRFLKLPYMLRESNQADIARTIAVMPDVRYVDLPEGIFSDDRTYAALRLEVQHRCADLRKMTYSAGAEQNFAVLAQGSLWSNMEVLELKRMNIDPVVLRRVLGVLTNLRALKITETRSFTDEVFVSSEMLPPFPPLEEFVLTDTPHVTAEGLIEYLADAPVRDALSVLTLTRTGVQLSGIRRIVGMAHRLRTLAISAQVAAPFPRDQAGGLMESHSIETLRYEISAEPASSPFSNAAPSHYSYLASSILSGGFPRLRAVYVRDANFSEQLLGLLPPTPFGHRRASSSVSGGNGHHRPVHPPAGGHGHGLHKSLPGPVGPPHGNRASSGSGGSGSSSGGRNGSDSNAGPLSRQQSCLTRTLEVFSKDEDGMDWNFVQVQPNQGGGGHGRRAPAASPRVPVSSDGFESLMPAPGRNRRPVSSYGLEADVTGLGWDKAGARLSVMVGNGAGGFLAVPGEDGTPPLPTARRESSSSAHEEWPRPRSSGGERGNKDLWR